MYVTTIIKEVINLGGKCDMRDWMGGREDAIIF